MAASLRALPITGDPAPGRGEVDLLLVRMFALVAEGLAAATDMVARRAAEVLRGARGDDLDAERLDAVAEQLATLARDPWCPPRVQIVLADWRDRLGSYVLTARALIEVGISPEHVRNLLQRGLTEVVEELPLRLEGLHAIAG